ncbi:MAG: ATP-binding protein [Acidimicrobiales bacterium]
MCERLERELPCRVASVGVGRRWVARTIEGWGFVAGDLTRIAHDDAVLAASELVAAAVRECSASLVVSLEAHHDRIGIDVVDRMDRERAAAWDEPADADTGRSVALVSAVSRRWGIEASGEADGQRRRRWCEISVPEGAVLRITCKM